MKVAIIGCGIVGSNTGKIFKDVTYHDPFKGMVIEDFSEFHYAIIAVPTPGTDKGLDHTEMAKSVALLKEKKFNGVMIIRSTCQPDFLASVDYHSLVYWPEFLRERTAEYDCLNPHLVVLGGTNYLAGKLREDLESLNHGGTAKWAVTDIPTAAMIKIGLNSALSAKLAFFNSLYEASEKVGANWQMLRLSIGADPRIGVGQTEVPGPDGKMGFGGKCLPKDLTALSNLAKDNVFLKSILSYNKTVRKD